MSRLTEAQERNVLLCYSQRQSTNYVRVKTGHSLATVKRVLLRYGIEHRPARARKISDRQVEDAIRGQRKGRSVESLARDLGIRAPNLRRRMRLLGYDPTDTRLARQAEHHNWKGGRTKVGGYIRVAVSVDDPYFAMADDRGYVLEHRLVMARSLGRPLLKSETVHHINLTRDDNRLKNLQLRRGRHGNGVVLRCARCGSHDVVEEELA